MELLVVLVILAILASLLLPALTGFIEKAHEARAEAAARSLAVAAKCGFAEWYGSPDALQPTPGVGDADSKWDLGEAMEELVFSECGMKQTREARAGSNGFQIVSSDMSKQR